MLCRSLLTVSVGLLFSAKTVAQDLATGEFRARVTTKGGNHIRGILEEVTDEHLYVDHMNSGSHHGIEKIPLTVISKVALRSNRRRHTLEGAVVGGGLASFVTIQSSKKNGFRSPVVYGINLAIAVGGGAVIGALIGRAIGPLTRKTIRPFGQTRDQAAESLRRQLKPFTIKYRNDLLNRVPQ